MQDINQLGCSLHISEKAAKVFSEMCEDEKKNTKESYLRVGAHSGGCSGWKYILDYDNEVNPTDLLFEEHGISLFDDLERYIDSKTQRIKHITRKYNPESDLSNPLYKDRKFRYK